jgi:phage-related protein
VAKDFSGTVFETAIKQRAVIDPFEWLVELEVPSDPPTRYRITSGNESLSYGVSSIGTPIPYYPFPVAIGDLLEQKSGDLPEMTINVANISRELMPVLELYDGLEGAPVRIRLVNRAALDDPYAQIAVEAKVSRVRVKEDVAIFSIGTSNLTKVIFPKNRLLANDCLFRFGSAECGYPIPASPTEVIGGGFSTCGRTFGECDIRGDDEVARSLPRLHPRRFDGCPGVRSGGPA